MRHVYPKHFYEWIENEKAQALQTYNRAIKRVEEDKLTRENQYNLASELQVELDYLGYISSFMLYKHSKRAELAFSLHKHDTLSTALNKIIDACEKVFSNTFYEMLTDETYMQDRSCFIRYYDPDKHQSIQIVVYIDELETCVQKIVKQWVDVIEYECSEKAA